MFQLSTAISGHPPQGLQALEHLLDVAHRGTGQSSVVARFLLSLYNGDRFPFDLTDFRRLDTGLFQDCIAVLLMDNVPQREVHRYFNHGDVIWEALAVRYGHQDHNLHSWQ